MKVEEITPPCKSFKPIKLEITIESMEELASLYVRCAVNSEDVRELYLDESPNPKKEELVSNIDLCELNELFSKLLDLFLV